jgi:hypothetical protein
MSSPAPEISSVARDPYVKPKPLTTKDTKEHEGFWNAAALGCGCSVF